MSNVKTTVSNPFDFTAEAVQSAPESRKLDFTPTLIAKSMTIAQEVMVGVSKKPELFDLANRAIDDGQAQDLIDLITAMIGEDRIKAEAKILEGCDDNQLGRLLESRRSDRSKLKAKNPRTNAQVCKSFLAAMVAEMLVREYWQKPYTGQLGSALIDVDSSDQDAISRKIKSLQSKKSRLGKLAAYDEDANKELQAVVTEIDRLNALRPTVRATTKVIVKDISVDAVRNALKLIDVGSVPADQQEALQALMAKLG